MGSVARLCPTSWPSPCLITPVRRPAGFSSRMITDFEVGVLLPSALESSGTSGFVSG